MDYLRLQDSINPGLKHQRALLQQRLEDFKNHQLPGKLSERAVYTIPVVVHVVYKNSIENISMSQIQSQIDVLNRDFRKLNTDVSLTPSVWASLASDVGIEFCLAQRDPNGNITDGVVRVATTVPSFSMANEVKFSNQGGSDAWPADEYLNLWVCDLGSGLLGYAQFPGGGSPSTDGVVIKYTNFGTNGTATPPYNLGRTATHEIGHWLNLFHIWGDEPQCSADDQVTDTPQQKDSNGGCPEFPLTTGPGSACSGVNGSMFMNYMDYVHDNCMYMFTQGQKDRMLAALLSFRSSLTTSAGCDSPFNPGDTLCDTVGNFLSSHTPSLYRPSDVGSLGTGWVSGTNSLEDKAKADKFNLLLNNWQSIHGLYLIFGYAYITDPNTVINIRIWDNDGPSGTPGTVLGNRPVTLGSIAMSIQLGNPYFVTFNPPIGTDGAFFAGIEFPAIGFDTIALVTNAIGDSPISTAWEQWADNSWHAYTDNVSWQLELSHAVFPVLCSVVGQAENQNVSTFKVFPVPAHDDVFVLPSSASEEPEQIELWDMSGRIIANPQWQRLNDGGIKLSTADLAAGVYGIRIISSGRPHFLRFIVRHH